MNTAYDSRRRIAGAIALAGLVALGGCQEESRPVERADVAPSQSPTTASALGPESSPVEIDMSGDSSGQLFGHSSGQPCDASSACCVGTQHSTRTPPLQSAGIPTSPQTAARSPGIRMRLFYGNASDRSTSHGIAATAPLPGRLNPRHALVRKHRHRVRQQPHRALLPRGAAV